MKVVTATLNKDKAPIWAISEFLDLNLNLNLKLHEGSFPALIIIPSPSVVLFAPLRAAEHFCEIKVVCFWAVTWDTVTNY